MSIEQIKHWLNAHREEAFDLIRIYLGIGLFARGVLFVLQPANSVDALVAGGDAAFVSAAVIHVVALAHLFGGAILALGLLTRLAALVQMPVLVGAVFLIHFQEGLLTTGQSLEFSALVLFLLVLVFLFGAGRWSADYYIFEREPLPESKRVSDVLRTARRARRSLAGKGGGEPFPSGAAACSCGHAPGDREVTANPQYGPLGGARFLFGITGRPKEVVYRCEACGGVVERSRSPELLRYHQYH